MSRSRRLLSVAHSYAVRANRRLVHEIARQSDDWEVVAVAPDQFSGRRDLRRVDFEVLDEEPCPVRVVPAHLTEFVHLFFYGLPLRKILAESWDLVHCWEEPYILVGAQVAFWAKGRPVVFRSAQSIDKNYPPPFSWFERYTVSRSSGWICSGKTVEDTLMARKGYDAIPHRRIPLGVDTKAFRRCETMRNSALAELGWGKGPPVVGFVGRFVDAKGVKLLMKALDAVQSPWRAIFLGAGVLEADLREWAAMYGDNVRIVTALHDDVPRYLNVMDLLCAPSQTSRSWREQFGRMIIEAFACGVPVIGSTSGEIPTVVGTTGVVVNESESSPWIESIETMLESPDKRRELGELGRARAAAEFAWPVVAKQHIEFFDELSYRT